MTPLNDLFTRVLIIGGGPAGYTAAIYAARALLEPIVVEGQTPGGQLMATTDVENFPGFPKGVQGPALMEAMRQQAQACGTVLVPDHIVEVDFHQRPFVAKGTRGVYTSETVIIATGAQANWLGLPSETLFRGYGVSACATCDGFFFRQKDVAVVGGGDTAAEEALYLAEIARSVVLIHRRDSLRAKPFLQQRLFEHPKIRILWNSQVVEVHGDPEPQKKLTHLTLGHTLDHSTSTLKVDGLFVAIGHTPNSRVFSDFLETHSSGYIVTEKDSCRTAIPGVFAAGDVKDSTYRQAITAAGLGCMAALDAESFLRYASA